MHTSVSWFATSLFLLPFFATFILFHPIHFFASVLSVRIFRASYAAMNGVFLLLLRVFCGTKFSVSGLSSLPTHGPVLIVANHQSIFDIPLISWHLRSLNPVFVSKKELGYGIPSVSLSLRSMGAALIDRQDRKQALREISALAMRIKEGKTSSIVLFPEGTRARDGAIKPFKRSGFKQILADMSECTIVPVAITGSFQIMKANLFPVPFGCTVGLTVLEPMVVKNGKAPRLSEIATRIASVLAEQQNNPEAAVKQAAAA